MKIGLIADLHGDFIGFQKALAIFNQQGIDRILCAGDIVDRGPEADAIVSLIKHHNIACIKGNHDYTVVENQAKWRASHNPARLTELGRIISDETVHFLNSLPDYALFRFGKIRIMMAHGTPWSDVIGIFPETRQGILQRLVERYGQETDLMILGHTHFPMRLELEGLTILNPGSIYGVTARDSRTCAILTIPELEFSVIDIETGEVKRV